MNESLYVWIPKLANIRPTQHIEDTNGSKTWINCSSSSINLSKSFNMTHTTWCFREKYPKVFFCCFFFGEGLFSTRPLLWRNSTSMISWLSLTSESQLTSSTLIHTALTRPVRKHHLCCSHDTSKSNVYVSIQPICSNYQYCWILLMRNYWKRTSRLHQAQRGKRFFHLSHYVRSIKLVLFQCNMQLSKMRFDIFPSLRSQQHAKVVPWMRKTEYISTEFNRYGVSNEKVEVKYVFTFKSFWLNAAC